MSKNKKRVLICGGGTGGHIFPAIAIANALKRFNHETEILFVGARGRMEMEKVPEAGYEIIGLNISGFQRRFAWKNLILPLKIVFSIIKAGKIIKKFRPDAVIGVGGYASGPILWIATKRKIPTLIQEQNSYPGITNKLLAKRVNKICVAYKSMEKFFPKDKIALTGNPVRTEITDILDKKEIGLEMFGLSPKKKTILVIGGSQGARTINESIEKSLEYFCNNNIQLIWQTGKLYYETALNACATKKTNGIRPHAFISKMDLAYASADIIISRAGAITISELCLIGKPVILIPSPNVSEDHQTKNALALANNNAAILVSDIEARDVLSNAVINLISDKKKCELLMKNIAQFAFRNADEKITEIIIKMMN